MGDGKQRSETQPGMTELLTFWSSRRRAALSPNETSGISSRSLPPPSVRIPMISSAVDVILYCISGASFASLGHLEIWVSSVSSASVLSCCGWTAWSFLLLDPAWAASTRDPSPGSLYTMSTHDALARFRRFTLWLLPRTLFIIAYSSFLLPSTIYMTRI